MQLCSICRKRIKDDTVDVVLAPKPINLPEPFFSAVSHYFSKENIAKIDYSQVQQLKKDLVNIALNLSDGELTGAGRLLNIRRSTVNEMRKKL